MASDSGPQLENGFTRVAHEWLEAFVRFRPPAGVMAFVLVVVRETWGYQRVWKAVPLRRFADLLGVSERRARLLREQAQAMGLISVQGPATAFGACKYRVQKRPELWVKLEKGRMSQQDRARLEARRGQAEQPCAGTTVCAGGAQPYAQDNRIPQGADCGKVGEGFPPSAHGYSGPVEYGCAGEGRNTGVRSIGKIPPKDTAKDTPSLLAEAGPGAEVPGLASLGEALKAQGRESESDPLGLFAKVVASAVRDVKRLEGRGMSRAAAFALLASSEYWDSELQQAVEAELA